MVGYTIYILFPYVERCTATETFFTDSLVRRGSLFSILEHKYYFEHNSVLMKKLEVILISLFLVACLMYISYVPGTGLFKTIFAMLLAQFYFALSFALLNGLGFRTMIKRVSYSSIKPGYIILAVIAGLVLANGVMAILFLSMRWPGAFAMAFFSTAILLALSILSLVLFAVKKAQVYNNILRRTFFMLTLTIILWSVSKMYWEIDLDQFKQEREEARRSASD